MRTRVLGAEYVQPATTDPRDIFAPAGARDRDCWGIVWTRPELPPRTRSMLTVAMLIARGQEQELALRVRGALNSRDGRAGRQERSRRGRAAGRAQREQRPLADL